MPQDTRQKTLQTAPEGTTQRTAQGTPRAAQALGQRRVRQFLSIQDVGEAPAQPVGDGRDPGAGLDTWEQDGTVAILRRARENARENKYRLMRQQAQAQARAHGSMGSTGSTGGVPGSALSSRPGSHPLEGRHFWTQMKFQPGNSGAHRHASSPPGGAHSAKENKVGAAIFGGVPRAQTPLQAQTQILGRAPGNSSLLESLVVRCGPYSDARSCAVPTLKRRQKRLWSLRQELVALMEAKRRAGKLGHCKIQGIPGVHPASGLPMPGRGVACSPHGSGGIPGAAMGPIAAPGTPGGGRSLSQPGGDAPLDPFFLAHVARLWGRVAKVEFEGQEAADCIEVLYGGILVGEFKQGREELAPPTGVPSFDAHIDRVLGAVGEHFFACYCSV